MRVGGRHLSRSSSKAGLTLLELLVSTAILSIVFLAIGAAMSSMQKSWLSLRGQADPFRASRQITGTVARRLSQATLRQRWETVPDPFNANTQTLQPRSDLHFVSGPAEVLLRGGSYTGYAVFFQTHLGWNNSTPNANSPAPQHDRLDNTLNACGYFVEYGRDDSTEPSFIGGGQMDTRDIRSKNRFRLYEWRQPTSELTKLFEPGNNQMEDVPALSRGNEGLPANYDWFQVPLQSGTGSKQRRISLVAENVIAFTLLPVGTVKNNAQANTSNLAPNGLYDTRAHQGNSNLQAQLSRHRLPKAFELTALIVSPEAWSKYTDGEADSLSGILLQQTRGKFQSPANVVNDFQSIAAYLDSKRLPYRIITQIIPMAEGLEQELPRL
jgi:uncharacterized protein (TIGR02599 family)